MCVCVCVCVVYIMVCRVGIYVFNCIILYICIYLETRSNLFK